LLSLPDRTRTTTTTSTIRNNPAASLSSCSIAFPAGQTEDDDDHDDDQGITSLPIIVLWSESFIRRFRAATSPAYYQPQKQAHRVTSSERLFLQVCQLPFAIGY
jgi:hypothetical protein